MHGIRQARWRASYGAARWVSEAPKSEQFNLMLQPRTLVDGSRAYHPRTLAEVAIDA